MSNAPFLRDTAGRLVTARLRLRQWVDADRPRFRALNRDPRVMAHFPALLTDPESDRLLDAMHAFLAANGIGLWAVERLADKRWIGFVGIQPVNLGVALDGAAEVGWRLDPAFWRAGYAVEAARAALHVAFAEMALPQVVATMVPGNTRSAATAERLGLTRRPELDFDHPARAPGHPLRATIVYGIDRP